MRRTVREPRGGAEPSIDSACDSAERGAGERPSALPLLGRTDGGLGAEAPAAAASAASSAASAESATRLGACRPCRGPGRAQEADHRHGEHAQEQAQHLQPWHTVNWVALARKSQRSSATMCSGCRMESENAKQTAKDPMYHPLAALRAGS